MDKFIVKGNICYSKNQKEIITVKNGFVVVENGISQGVFKELPQQYSNFIIYDYGDNLVIPGMCDMHIHAPQYSYRGTGMDLQLLDWLNTYAFPEESKFTNLDYAQKAYSIFADELKKGATTRACIFATIHKDATLLLMEKMEKSGLTSYVGKVNMDRNSPDYLSEHTSEEAYKNTKDWIEKSLENIKEGKFKNTMPMLTPRFIPSCTDELMSKLEQLENQYNLAVQSHLSENLDEIEWVRQLRKDSKFYGDAYNKSNLFGGNNKNGNHVKTVMAHCVWSGDEEIELMKENEVFIAHCPASNSNIASGIAPIRKYLEKGLNVCLGTDVAGGHSDSMFRAITDAIQVSKLYYRLVDQNSKPLIFEEGFYLATLGGGKFFGKVGSFEKDYSFDALILNDRVVDFPQEMTLKDRLERAIYLSFDQRGMVAKFANGKKII